VLITSFQGLPVGPTVGPTVLKNEDIYIVDAYCSETERSRWNNAGNNPNDTRAASANAENDENSEEERKWLKAQCNE
jgi:hypothetical protein